MPCVRFGDQMNILAGLLCPRMIQAREANRGSSQSLLGGNGNASWGGCEGETQKRQCDLLAIPVVGGESIL